MLARLPCEVQYRGQAYGPGLSDVPARLARILGLEEVTERVVEVVAPVAVPPKRKRRKNAKTV